ncbi:tRNA dimethylallyltransferase [Lachancea thermotolerans CBS 6340]|uniref:tRNA dimethylallyltransferase n=1 Tax=Lachancea thermotolerans (strain ATCC 56472 / CBS 6340 / NRRL Y-8284) TaxID=559295 RepID=C5DF56_LACTC|nr:KLTH0D12386p [Lachancea thermotolerans CBS 6340]CAR22811.1 KLTH0D12386p [Lachancea thermotolerans CBS 6340]
MLRWISQKLAMSAVPRPKVIVIAGTTGVGKSQLSIQLASRVSGEVINSDSMQVYKDIPIITNKHPIEERENVAHHVMNHVSWDEEYFLHRFEKECLNAIKDIHSRGKIPIIVGGTHYYLQILLEKRIEKKTRALLPEEQAILDSNEPHQLYSMLKEVDPDIASKYHPNDIRRVRRMLEIYFTTGQKPSQAFSEQKQSLVFDTLFLWVYSSPEVLEGRLDKRVDAMMESGALNEIRQLHEYYNSCNYSVDKCENGVWQVIGFKEFLPWLENADGSSFCDSVDRMKVRTRQYAKKQVKWIKKMLLPDVKSHLYALDATDLNHWDENVSQRAFSIADSFISNRIIEEPFVPPSLEDVVKNNDTESNSPKTAGDWSRQQCDICRDKDDNPLVAIGEKSWNIHLKSRRHRSNLSRIKKRENLELWKKKKAKEICADEKEAV